MTCPILDCQQLPKKGLPGYKSGPQRMMGMKAPERDNLEGVIPLSVLMTLGENLAILSSLLLILG